MLEIRNVTFSYGLRKPVLRDFSLQVPEKGRICLMGVSGKGKTTVLRLLMGLEKPRHGEVILPQGLRVSAVFQEERLLREKSVLENVAMFSDIETAAEVLTGLGLGDAIHENVTQLSGGMKRRAALARALAHPFDLLILDEALTGLDEENKKNCLALIDQAAADKYLVMVTHTAAEAEMLGARVLTL